MDNFCTQVGLRWTPKLSENHLNPNKVPTVVWNGPKHSKSLIMTYWNRHIESILGHKGLLLAFVSALTIWEPRLTIATIGNRWFIIYALLLNPDSTSTCHRCSICACSNFLPSFLVFVILHPFCLTWAWLYCSLLHIWISRPFCYTWDIYWPRNKTMALVPYLYLTKLYLTCTLHDPTSAAYITNFLNMVEEMKLI